MPRSHGRIMAAIWNDADFLALPEGPQRLYLFLLSQPDLSHAGLVPMRVRRWAKKVAGATAETVRAYLADLEDARFVVADDDTEEVLIRTFVRNDGVYRQPKVMLRMREDARQIESAALRDAFRRELDRLPLHELSTQPTGRDHDGPSTFTSVSAVVETLREDFPNPTAGVSDGVSDTPRVRAGVFPQPPTPSPLPPSPVPATPGAAEASRALVIADGSEPNAQTLVAEWIDHCETRPPGRVVGQIAKEVGAMLDEGVGYERVRAGLADWNTRDLHPSTLPSVVHGLTNRRAPQTNRQAAEEAMFARQMERAVAREAGQS